MNSMGNLGSGTCDVESQQREFLRHADSQTLLQFAGCTAEVSSLQAVASRSNARRWRRKAGEGIGGPHTGADTIWPMSIILRAITSVNEAEVKNCIDNLVKTHAGTGFMHESFHKDDASKFTRKWFAWANTLFGEMIMHTNTMFPGILKR